MILAILLSLSAHAGPALEGTWRQPCARGYQREERFEGAFVTYVERNFWDGSCTAPAVEILSRGAFEAGEPVLAPLGARAMDFTFASVSLRPRSVETAAAYNQRAVCGLSGWRVDEEQEITGRDCDFFGLGAKMRVPSAGDRKFGIFRLEGDELFFGQLSPERDGSAPSRRPLVLDPRGYRRATGE